MSNEAVHPIIPGEVVASVLGAQPNGADATVHHITSLPQAEGTVLAEGITPAPAHEGASTQQSRSAAGNWTQPGYERHGYETDFWPPEETPRVRRPSSTVFNLGDIAVGFQPVTSQAERQKPNKFTPTYRQRLNGLSNDLVADVMLSADDPAALTEQQRSGIANRLYKTLRALGGEQSLESIKHLLRDPKLLEADIKPDVAFGKERAWIQAAQQEIYEMLGGLPNGLIDPAKRQLLDKIPKFHMYHPASERPYPTWNERQLAFTERGSARAAALRNANLGLAA